MLKISLFLIALFLAASSVISQKLPEILSTAQLQKGIYKNYIEFITNSPSIPDEFKLVERESFATSSTYFLVMLDSSSLTRKERIRVWGLCDGKNIYVNERNYGGPYGFRTLIGLGRYCYFIGSIAKTTLPTYSPSTTYSDGYYIMNINNGTFHPLTNDVLGVILKNDAELAALYKDEKSKGSNLIWLQYVKEYNNKHLYDATLERLEPIEIILYMRSNSKISSPLRISVNDSLSFTLTPGKVLKFNSRDRLSKLCLNDACSDVLLSRKGINYFECIWKKDSESPFAQHVDSKTAEFYVKEIERKNKK